MAGLTEQEKERARYHMGYLLTTLAASIQLGIPQALPTLFIVEQSLILLTNQFAVERVQRILTKLDNLENKLEAAQCTLVASELGSLKLHPLKDRGLLFTDSLEKEYVRWAKRLSDILGAPLYAYSDRFRRRGPGTNVGVSG